MFTTLLGKCIEDIEYNWNEISKEDNQDKNNKLIKEDKEIKNIFISHITEEKEIALILKDWIQDTFFEKIEVFVSNDTDCITVGDIWLDRIKDSIDKSDLLIAICSKVSMPRPWINIEIGCAWAKDIPIMPICHSGITKSNLPSPVSIFHGIDIDSIESLKILFKSIAKHLKVAKIPRISYQDMIDEINEALGKVVIKEVPIKEVEKTVKETTVKKEDFYGKKDFCEKILKVYMDEELYLNFIEIAKKMQNNPQLVLHYLDKLVDDDYLYGYESVSEGIQYSLSPKGREYMIETGIIN